MGSIGEITEDVIDSAYFVGYSFKWMLLDVQVYNKL